MSLLNAIHRARHGVPDVKAVLDAALEPEATNPGNQPEAAASNPQPATTAEHKDPVMSEQTTTGGATQPDQTAIANARAEGATTERSRIKAIVTHAEADGRGKLAAHLAFATSMSADEAGALLAASPKESAAAPQQSAAETYEASRTGAEGLAQPAPKKDAASARSGLTAAVDKAVDKMKK